MDTVYRLKVSELGIDFVQSIQALFKKADEVEIIVHKTKVNSLKKKETREEYWERIDRSIADVKNNRNLIRFSPQEFEEYSKQLLKEK